MMPKSERPSIAKTNDDLLRDWDDWLAERDGRASLEDVFASGNHLLFAGMLLKGFRKVTRQAVFDRFKPEARKRGFSNAKPTTASFFFMVECVANAWALTDEEKLRLLGLEKAADLETLRDQPFQDISRETLERAGLLLDIFIILNAIFSQDSADRWIHAPNTEPLFGGSSALTTMIEGGVASLESVKLYLWAKAAGN
jgi:hypothetical protein